MKRAQLLALGFLVCVNGPFLALAGGILGDRPLLIPVGIVATTVLGVYLVRRGTVCNACGRHDLFGMVPRMVCPDCKAAKSMADRVRLRA